MTKPRRILVALESRATYGYSKNVMLAMRDFPGLELTTLVTGMHLVPELGNSVELIRDDGFPISAEVPMHAADGAPNAWAVALGEAIAGFSRAYQEVKPDILLVSGDRIETFGCTVAAAYMGIPIAHVQAGDRSGHIDDSARHAIGKFAHIHLASCEDSANRLRRMGEQEFRIHNVGAPQLDNIVNRDWTAASLKVADRRLDLGGPYLLVVQHSVMAEVESAGAQVESTLKACERTGLPVVVIYPNSDLGYSQIIRRIEERSVSGRFVLLQNVERESFLTLLANCAVLVGNSSTGILEAPSFRRPVVNIGNRQRGRPQAANVLNCGYDSGEIERTIRFALSDVDFRRACEEVVNPYGDGQSSERICRILESVNLDGRLIDKEVTY